MTSALKETPLHGWHVARKARMVDFSGWSMPVQYSSIVEEHQATRTAAGIFDISHMGRLRFDGKGAAAFLDKLLTRRVVGLGVSQIRYSLMTNEAGGILDDVLVYHLAQPQGDPFHQLVVNAGNREKIVSWIQQHLAGETDVQFRDETLETAMIAVQGPQAHSILSPIVPEIQEELDYYTGRVISVNGSPASVSRTGYTGEDGYELVVASSVAAEVWNQVTSAAETAAGLPVGLGARDTLRLEAAMPLYGHELSEEINPYVAGLGFAVQLKDRRFIGSEALRELKAVAPSRKRVGLELTGRRVAREDYAVMQGGSQVGAISSGTFSPTLERPIAMAYVQPQLAEVGTSLEVDIRGKSVDAKVVALPFYQR